MHFKNGQSQPILESRTKCLHFYQVLGRSPHMATLKTKERQSANLEWAGIRFEPAPESARHVASSKKEIVLYNLIERLTHTLVSVIACRNYTRQRLYHTPTRTLLSYTKFITSKSDFVWTLLNSLRKDLFFLNSRLCPRAG